MPLRDHFHPPLDDETSWEGLHGQWPGRMVAQLNSKLPSRYVASPRVHLGAAFEIDVAASEKDAPAPDALAGGVAGGNGAGAVGGAATAVWAPPRPTLAVTTELPDQDEYEVRVYDVKRRRRLVAAVELVSPANKDRPENRRAFAAKCAALVRQGVSVGIVDVVTTRRSNLYGDMLDLLGRSDPFLSPEAPPIYAVICRWRRTGDVGQWESWAHSLTIGQALPTLPLWVADDFSVPLDLELTYEETCRELRID